MSDTYISRCNRCLGPNDAWGSFYCGACRQVQATEKQTKSLNKLESQRSLQATFDAMDAADERRQRAREQQQAAIRAEEDAELAQVQSKKNVRLIAEGTISYDDAFKHGLYSESTGTLFEDGSIGILYVYNRYQLDLLNQAFRRGVKESLKDAVGESVEYMKEQAYLAGYNGSDSFTIKTTDAKITTKMFCSSLKRELNLENGSVSYTHKNPFESEELNQCYLNGLNERTAEENTPLKISERMSTEVVEILAKQARVAEKQRLTEENARIQQEINAAKSKKDEAERVSKKQIRLYVVITILLAIVGFIVGLWVTNHPFLSIIAGCVAFCGLFSGWLGPLFEYYENDY